MKAARGSRVSGENFAAFSGSISITGGNVLKFKQRESGWAHNRSNFFQKLPLFDGCTEVMVDRC